VLPSSALVPSSMVKVNDGVGGRRELDAGRITEEGARVAPGALVGLGVAKEVASVGGSSAS
jgi:hypothetical protein